MYEGQDIFRKGLCKSHQLLAAEHAYQYVGDRKEFLETGHVSNQEFPFHFSQDFLISPCYKTLTVSHAEGISKLSQAENRYTCWA